MNTAEQTTTDFSQLYAQRLHDAMIAIAGVIGVELTTHLSNIVAHIADLKSVADLAIKREIDNELLRRQLIEMAQAVAQAKTPLVIHEGESGTDAVIPSMIDGFSLQEWREARRVLTEMSGIPNPRLAATLLRAEQRAWFQRCEEANSLAENAMAIELDGVSVPVTAEFLEKWHKFLNEVSTKVKATPEKWRKALAQLNGNCTDSRLNVAAINLLNAIDSGCHQQARHNVEAAVERCLNWLSPPPLAADDEHPF